MKNAAYASKPYIKMALRCRMPAAASALDPAVLEIDMDSPP